MIPEEKKKNDHTQQGEMIFFLGVIDFKTWVVVAVAYSGTNFVVVQYNYYLFVLSPIFTIISGTIRKSK